MVFYQYEPQEPMIRIAQVLHGSRDIEAVLGGEE
jgi:plasmid stabilization system protein ParE